MGQRGPKAAEPNDKRKYKKRIIVPKRLPVDTDGQLVAAQHFNERIDEFLAKLNGENYPLSGIEPNLLEQAVEMAELLQESVVSGIEAYEVRRSPSGHEDSGESQINEDGFLPGAFDMGRKTGRGGVRRGRGEG